MVLRGVLEASFGNILCLRGFAKLGELADISTADESYQREVDERHKNDIADFYDSGEYTFFPELILGVPLSALKLSGADIEDLYGTVATGEAKNLRNKGGITIKTFVKRYRDAGFHRLVSAAFYGFENFMQEKVVKRIDGNHRLEAVERAEDRIREYQAPFCLVLFRNEDECQSFGRVFFHMINFRGKPISEEKNLELILDHDVFDDEKLLRKPFGAEYWLARWFFMARWMGDGFGVNKPAVLNSVSRTVLLHFFTYLLLGG